MLHSNDFTYFVCLLFLKEVPLKGLPVLLPPEMGSAPIFKIVPNKMIETYETSTFYKESTKSTFQESQEIFNRVHRFPNKSLGQGSTLSRAQLLDIQSTAALFEGIALSDAFLRDYYTQVQYCPAV